MFENRIRNFLAAPVLVPAFAGCQPAFVACPLNMFPGFGTSQQAFIAEVYRLAQELTEAQLSKPRQRIPAFSRN